MKSARGLSWHGEPCKQRARPMAKRKVSVGVVTDEVALNLEDAFAAAAAWGVRRFEIRHGQRRRFPYLTPREGILVEDARRAGAQITAVSPGLFKRPVADETHLAHEIVHVLP